MGRGQECSTGEQKISKRKKKVREREKLIDGVIDLRKRPLSLDLEKWINL